MLLVIYDGLQIKKPGCLLQGSLVVGSCSVQYSFGFSNTNDNSVLCGSSLAFSPTVMWSSQMFKGAFQTMS